MSKKRFFDIIKNPPIWLMVLTYAVTAVSIIASIILALMNRDNALLQALSYLGYVLATAFLGYSIYTFVVIAPKIRRSVRLFADKHDFVGEIFKNYGMRTIIFAIVSFAISLAYGAYNLTLSALEKSVWYGVLAVYYVLLASMRGGVISHHRRLRIVRKSGGAVENEKTRQIKRYRNCGITLIVMTFALLIAVLQMVFEHSSFENGGLMIYVAAAYTFYKVAMSIINIAKAKKQTDMTVLAIRDINLADAMVSILALQTSMFHSFDKGGGKFVDIMNGMTGALVCAATLTLGVYMIIKANGKLKRLEIEDEPDIDTSEDEENNKREVNAL